MARQALARLKITQKELARRTGESEPVLSRLFQGKETRCADVVAEALGIPAPQVFIENELEYRWFMAGRRLTQLEPSTSEEYLAAIEERVKAAEARVTADARFGIAASTSSDSRKPSDGKPRP